jgi:hypothetical protein
MCGGWWFLMTFQSIIRSDDDNAKDEPHYGHLNCHYCSVTWASDGLIPEIFVGTGKDCCWDFGFHKMHRMAVAATEKKENNNNERCRIAIRPMMTMMPSPLFPAGKRKVAHFRDDRDAPPSSCGLIRECEENKDISTTIVLAACRTHRVVMAATKSVTPASFLLFLKRETDFLSVGWCKSRGDDFFATPAAEFSNPATDEVTLYAFGKNGETKSRGPEPLGLMEENEREEDDDEDVDDTGNVLVEGRFHV